MKTKIINYGMNGEGIGKVDGKIVMIDGCLIDEIVDFEIIKENKNYSVGNLISICSSSKSRIYPPCPHFNDCGGCDLQHMNYEEQLKFKTNLVRSTLKKIANINFDVSETVGCNSQFNYRNKASFNFLNEKFGFYKRNSKDIVNIEKCMISHDVINKVFHIFVEFLHKNPHVQSSIKNLVVRHINNQTLVGVVVKSNLDLSDFFKELQLDLKNVGLYEIINTRNDSVVLSGKVNHVGGIEKITISNFGVTYFVDLIGFHQTNIEIQNKIYENVLNSITPESIVVNGFSGQGLLTSILATKAKQAIGIEINTSSHISAEQLKKQNNIRNMRNIKGDFSTKFKEVKTEANFLILDPAKRGCGESIMKTVDRIENIIYISCNPIALAKDLRILCKNYEILEITPYDMFPNTKNVETLVKLKRKSKEEL